LIYSDPLDDGFNRGTTFPNGPWRPKASVHRGSLAYLNLCGGDPSLDRIDECLGKNGKYKNLTPKIPVLPLSWGDAEPILRALNGPNVPTDWQGGLNFTYKIGPGPAVVNVYTNMDYNTTTIWNVIAKIPGDSEQVIILGNHRDAWVFGAVDPSSASSSMLEMARGFGELLKNGWQPKRSIILASWDAEEFGLIGSTWYAENNADFLSQNAIAYINCDQSAYGIQLSVDATSSLSSLIRYAASRVIDPSTNKTLSQVWDGKVYTIGSGSDYTAFVHHLGIASIDLRFKGNYGVYHSIYDDFYWISHFGDPTFQYHKAASQFWGILAIHLADSDILPFDYTDTFNILTRYLQEVRTLIKDPKLQSQLCDPIQDAISYFGTASQNLQETIQSGTDLDVNQILFSAERQFLYQAGLQDRPWYKHMLQAPGLFKGYGADSLPGLTQAINDNDWNSATEYSNIISVRIKAAADYITLSGPSQSNDYGDGGKIALAVILILVFVALPIAGAASYYWRRLN